MFNLWFGELTRESRFTSLRVYEVWVDNKGKIVKCTGFYETQDY